MGKVIVTGGRNYSDRNFIYQTLDHFKPTEIINGGASGADRISTEYAKERNIPLKIYNADWDFYGRSAGPVRNELMLSENSDAIVLAFAGGKGTQDCVTRAIVKKMKIYHEMR